MQKETIKKWQPKPHMVNEGMSKWGKVKNKKFRGAVGL
jgi:hypothetical protein